METLLKRIGMAGWVAFASFIAIAIPQILENLDLFQLSPLEKALFTIAGTSLVAVITKQLNTEK